MRKARQPEIAVVVAKKEMIIVDRQESGRPASTVLGRLERIRAVLFDPFIGDLLLLYLK
jgi:hypothetical protein